MCRKERREGRGEEEEIQARRAHGANFASLAMCKPRFLAVQYYVDVTTTTKCNRVRDKRKKKKKKKENETRGKCDCDLYI